MNKPLAIDVWTSFIFFFTWIQNSV